MKIGIYTIFNIITHRQYIGQASDIDRRLNQHLRALNSKTHKNKHLQASWNLYGKDSFIFYSILEFSEYDKTSLTKAEQFYLDLFGIDNLYNFCPAAESRFGTKMSKDSIEKIRLSKIGRPSWNFGKKKTDFPQLSKSGAKKGHIPWNKGKSCSPETKKKLSKFNKGKNLSIETRNKISKTMKLKGINPHNYRNK